MNMNNYQRRPIWRSKHPFFKNTAPHNLQNWLTNRGSLTHALTHACPNEFSVRVLNESWLKPNESERYALGLANNVLTFVRQVHLFCGEHAWVYARTVIPARTLRGELQKLTQLGNQSLGAILFANKHIQRGNIEITKIPLQHQLHHLASMHSPKTTQEIWGRRSLFYIANNPLIVSEFFLPEIINKTTCQQL